MNKLLNLLFPLPDHLYIFQLLEYDNADFLKWFFTYPFKRNLQRKHTLVWTPKALVLFLVSCFLIIFLSIASSVTQFYTFILSPIFFILYSIFSPFFLIAANLLFYPFEAYSKNKLIKAAQRKQRKLKDLKVVAIVGSFAKTSTKNMLYTLLWKDFYTVKTPKSYNTAVSIARSFLRDVKEATQVFLVEMDAYHPGEIKQLCSIIKPDYGVITAIGAQHLERFGSMEKLAKTQFELAVSLAKTPHPNPLPPGEREMLSKGGGMNSTGERVGVSKGGGANGTGDGEKRAERILFLNADDEWTNKLYPDYDGIRQVYFGVKEGKDAQATDIKVYANKTTFDLRLKNQEVKIELPLAGEHHALNFAAAAAIAYQFGLSLEQIKKRAELILPTEHRLEVKKTGHVTIIDNTYNTNPTAARASLKLLKETSGSEKIVVTPGLVELGSKSEEENVLLGEEIAKVADVVIVVGEYAKEYLKTGLEKVKFPSENIHFVSSTSNALNLVFKIGKKDAVVLLENDLPDQYF